MNVVEPDGTGGSEVSPREPYVPGVVSVAAPDDISIWQEGLAASRVEHAVRH